MNTHILQGRNWLPILVIALIALSSGGQEVLAQRGRTNGGQRAERKSGNEAQKAETSKARAGRATDKRRRQAVRRDRRGSNNRLDRRSGRRSVPQARSDRRSGRTGWRHSQARNRSWPDGRRRSWNRVDVRFSWPIVIRGKGHWRPRIRYRQIIHIDARWSRDHRRSRLEFETVYRHRVIHADDRYAVLEIDVDEILLYEDGRYVGSVRRIPRHLSRVEVTVDRTGYVTFDRDLFIVGDRRVGFELISAPYADGHLVNSRSSRHSMRVGVLDLRRERVRSVRRSRLFDPRHFRGYVPMSVLPQEANWLWDAGLDAISDASHGGYGGSRYEVRKRSSVDVRLSTDFGADIRFSRESHIQRVE